VSVSLPAGLDPEARIPQPVGRANRPPGAEPFLHAPPLLVQRLSPGVLDGGEAALERVRQITVGAIKRKQSARLQLGERLLGAPEAHLAVDQNEVERGVRNLVGDSGVEMLKWLGHLVVRRVDQPVGYPCRQSTRRDRVLDPRVPDRIVLDREKMGDPAREPNRAAPGPPLETTVRGPKPVVENDYGVSDDRRRLGMLPSERLFDQSAPEVRGMEVLSVQQPSSSIRRRRAAADEQSGSQTRPLAAHLGGWLPKPNHTRSGTGSKAGSKAHEGGGCVITLQDCAGIGCLRDSQSRRLLVDRQQDLMGWQVDVQTDDVPELSGAAGTLNGLTPPSIPLRIRGGYHSFPVQRMSMHEEGGGVTWDAAKPSRCLAAPGFSPNHSGGRTLLNPNHRAGQPIDMAPDEDWCRRLTTSYTRFAQNEQVAPDITAVVPVYNTPATHLDECVRSLLRQTVRPREILVIDDGTTLEETDTYLNALRDLPDVRLVRNDRNISLGPTMNRALQLCQTEFLLKLDSDDLARPQLVERFAAFLAENRSVDVLGCQSQNFGISNFVTNHPQHVTRDYVLSRYWFINHTGILLNRTSLLAVNGYRSMRRLAEDYELWVRMMLYGYRRFYNLPDVLVDYRDLPTGLHRNLRGKSNRAMKIVLRTLMRTCPNF
jgi:hypothetical protein